MLCYAAAVSAGTRQQPHPSVWRASVAPGSVRLRRLHVQSAGGAAAGAELQGRCRGSFRPGCGDAPLQVGLRRPARSVQVPPAEGGRWQHVAACWQAHATLLGLAVARYWHGDAPRVCGTAVDTARSIWARCFNGAHHHLYGSVRGFRRRSTQARSTVCQHVACLTRKKHCDTPCWPHVMKRHKAQVSTFMEPFLPF